MSQVGRYQILIALVVIVNTGMAWAQSNDRMTADGPLADSLTAFTKETSIGCSTFARYEYELTEELSEQRPSINGVMVADDMRCRQCRGKCTADNLRCRNQCLGDSACLAQCDEMKSTCETTCKQLLSCE